MFAEEYDTMFEHFCSHKVKSGKLLGVSVYSTGFVTKRGLQPIVCSNGAEIGCIQIADSKVESVC